ncbi:MAG: N-6 DNA methylase [Rickettsia aeschlimannii]
MVCLLIFLLQLSIPVAILVFDRSREEKGENQQRKDILFIDASGFFNTGKKGQNFLEDEHINKIRYIGRYENEEEVNIAELQKEIQ